VEDLEAEVQDLREQAQQLDRVKHQQNIELRELQEKIDNLEYMLSQVRSIVTNADTEPDLGEGEDMRVYMARDSADF
jgi:uncharacterized coiled-coil DUF342 family protein